MSYLKLAEKILAERGEERPVGDGSRFRPVPAPPQFTPRSPDELDAARHARWAARAAVLETSGMSASEADTLALEQILAEPRGTWTLAREGEGEMRLVVASDPPWPEAVHRAAALLEIIDAHHRSGRDSDAAAQVRTLAALLEQLSASGVVAWLG